MSCLRHDGQSDCHCNTCRALRRQGDVLDATAPTGATGKIEITSKGYEYILGDKEAHIAELEKRRESVVEFLKYTDRLDDREFVVDKVVDILEGRDKLGADR